jgi:hypothetical protein
MAKGVGSALRTDTEKKNATGATTNNLNGKIDLALMYSNVTQGGQIINFVEKKYEKILSFWRFGSFEVKLHELFHRFGEKNLYDHTNIQRTFAKQRAL